MHEAAPAAPVVLPLYEATFVKENATALPPGLQLTTHALSAKTSSTVRCCATGCVVCGLLPSLERSDPVELSSPLARISPASVGQVCP